MTKKMPASIEIPEGQDIILTIDGQPVVYLSAEAVKTRSTHQGEEYKQYNFCGMGIESSDPNGGWDDKYISHCATTLNIQVKGLLDSQRVIEAMAVRENIAWVKR
jgi:hypothetical protein